MQAVLALDVVSDAFDLSDLLGGDARAFQPHISILPRFETPDLDAAMFAHLRPSLGLTVELCGPEDNGTGLWWCECLPEMQGHRELTALHNESTWLLAGAACPVTPNFWGNGYRPHLTLGHEIDLPLLPRRLEVTVVSICLYVIQEQPSLAVQRWNLL